MEIGGPTNIQHVAHVTFDRFNGFLGLPSEFEPDVPKKAPSARFLRLLSFVFHMILMKIGTQKKKMKIGT